METDQFIVWALRQNPASTQKSVGGGNACKVLVALALHASVDGYAWPSSNTLAECTGLHRRTVRNALDLLVEQGYIKSAGKRQRANRYLFPLDQVAGDHAISGQASPLKQMAGDHATTSGTHLAGDLAGDLAGNMAGDLAGNMAGDHATNRNELNRTPLPPTQTPARKRLPQPEEGTETTPNLPPVSQALRVALASHGIPEQSIHDVWSVALADPENTYPESRLTKSQGYARHCLRAANAKRDADRAAGPRCLDHPEQPANSCTSCAADIKAGERPPGLMGKRIFGPAHVTVPDSSEEGIW